VLYDWIATKMQKAVFSRNDIFLVVAVFAVFFSSSLRSPSRNLVLFLFFCHSREAGIYCEAISKNEHTKNWTARKRDRFPAFG
jgi:hypothetical protein